MTTLTAVPLSNNPDTKDLFGKLEAMLGPHACFKSGTGTNFRYASKGDNHLTVSVKLDYSPYRSALSLTIRLFSLGSLRAFESGFKYRSQNGDYFRLNKFTLDVAYGSQAACLKQFTEGGVAKTIAAWLDSKVVAVGATPTHRLVLTLFAIYAATLGAVPEAAPKTHPVITPEVLEGAFDSSPTGNKQADDAYNAQQKQYVNTDASDDEPDSDPSNGDDELIDDGDES